MAATALFAAPAAQAFSESKAPPRPALLLPGLSAFAGNFSPSEDSHPGRRWPRGEELRWGTLGPDRDGGFRFGAKLSGSGGTWTLDHSDGHWRGQAAHRFRLGFSRRF